MRIENIIATNFVVGTLIFVAGFARADELDCLTAEERAGANYYSHLQQEAYAALDRRQSAFEQLRAPAEIRAWVQMRRAFMLKQLGGLPERSPLNAKTVGVLEEDGYRIEKVIYDSVPQHRITANLYLPDSEGPIPGVVVSSGHSRTAKTADYNQRFGIMMAKHGMAALCFDPIGQGERSQMLDEAGRVQHSSTTREHFFVGVGSTLVGRNTARYRVWDAMRSIDYLVSRKEIDPKRIGFTGCSGGGTLTSYVMALDDRVACAAPACYLTTFRHLIESIGPQDAEQNIYGQIAFGLDQPDYVLLRAPKPTLISSTTDDFFPIAGSWENYRQAKRVYTQLGRPECVDLVEAPGKHGVQPQNLAAIAHWMQRWLLGRDAPVKALEIATRPAEQLLCTRTGQVLTAFDDEQSVFDLNKIYAAELQKQREERPLTTNRLRRLLQLPKKLPPTRWRDIDRVRRDGYHVDKLVMRPDARTPLPALTYHPPEPDDAAYLYLHDAGKRGGDRVDGPIQKLIEEGYVTIAVDLSGQGETAATPKRDARLGDWKTYYLAYLLGKPLLGVRTADALAAADFVAYYEKKRPRKRDVHLVGEGGAGIVALHAAALRPDLFASVTLRNTPKSWFSSLDVEPTPALLENAVHGALREYDLPDLVKMVGENKVRFE